MHIIEHMYIVQQTLKVNNTYITVMYRQIITSKQTFFRGLINTSPDAQTSHRRQHRSRHVIVLRKKNRPKLCNSTNLSSELNSLIHRRWLPWKRTQATMDIKAIVGAREKKRNRASRKEQRLLLMKRKHLPRKYFLSKEGDF